MGTGRLKMILNSEMLLRKILNLVFILLTNDTFTIKVKV